MFEIISVCKGGGYKYCRTNPKHPKANSKGLYPLHRVIAENKIGRLLNNNEDVHHLNEDKSDNRLENLKVLTKSEHAKLHKTIELIKVQCFYCNKHFEIKPHEYRLRTKRNMFNKIFCSKVCSSTKSY